MAREISLVAPVDRDGRCRASTPMRPEDSLRGVVCDLDALNRLTARAAV